MKNLVIKLIMACVLLAQNSAYSMQPAQQGASELWNIVNAASSSTMRISSMENYLETAKRIFNSGNVNIKDSQYGDTPLIRLAYSNTPLATELAKLLIQNGADLNTKDNLGYTALMIAAMGNNFEIADLLINAKADKNVIREGATAFDIAGADVSRLFKGTPIEQIRKEVYGDQPNVATKKLFELANIGYLNARNPLEKVKSDIQQLIAQGADLKETRLNTPLLSLIISTGKEHPHIIQLVQFLIEKGIDVNQAIGFTPLMVAVLAKNPQLIKLLVANGADRTIKQRTINITAYEFALSKPEIKLALKDVLELLNPVNPVPAELKKLFQVKKSGIFLELETPEFLDVKK